jgi:hypothetical protein
MKDVMFEGANQFAWFDTVTERFLEYAGTQVWDSWDDFAEDFSEINGRELQRFLSLFPKEQL